jgi:hypothetical protein
MNEDLQIFWGMGILFGLVMLFAKSPVGWKYFHGIIFLCYFVNAYWEMNDGNHSGGGMYSVLVSIGTGLHIIVFLIGKVLFGFFRRHNLKTQNLTSLYQQANHEEKEI